MKTKQCTRCVGTGKVGNYAHVKNGVCFKCNGTGKQVVMKNERQQKVWYRVENEFGHWFIFNSKEKAEALVSQWNDMGVNGSLIVKTKEVIVKVPA